MEETKRNLKWLWYVFGIQLCFLLAGVGFILYLSWKLPSVESLKTFRPKVASEVFSDDYVKIGEFYKQRRIYVPLQNIPPSVAQAFIAAEDAEFFLHKGISLTGIFRAMLKNIMAGAVRQGGSTITQQVAKALLLSPERKYIRKAREAILAYKMEKYLSKEEILEIYLNEIYLGHSAYGVQAAAQAYFDKDVTELTVVEAALLAGLTKAPSRDNPYRNPDNATARRLYVLQRMLDEDYLTTDEYNQAKEEPLMVSEDSDLNVQYAPYFVEHIRRYLMEKYGDELVLTGGLQIYSTLLVSDAVSSQHAIQSGLENMDRRQGYRGPIQQLVPAQVEEFEKKLAEDQTDDPLRFDREYKAVVKTIDDDKGLTIVNLGTKNGAIPIESMKWARQPNADQFWESHQIEMPSQAFKVGDVIWVRPFDLEELKEEKKEIKIPDGHEIVTLFQEPFVQGAMISLDPKNGAIRSMVGGYNYRKSEFNRAVQARRQPGSSFKPIIYSAALDNGYTAASLLMDSPIVYDDPTSDFSWRPKNFGGKFHGNTIFRESLIKSRNVPTVKIVQDIGVDKVINYARRMGIQSPLTRDFSLALGSSAVIPLELVGAYASFAAEGRKVVPVAIKKIVDRDGNVLERNILDDVALDTTNQAGVVEQNRKKEEELNQAIKQSKENPEEVPEGFLLSPQTAYIMTHLLKQVIKIGTGRRAHAIGRPAAGKTGTTNDNFDAWFIGYTPTLVTGVWVGFDKAEKLGVKEFGGSAASPIWLSYMKEALKDTPVTDFRVPDGVIFAQIDAKSGQLATPKTEKPVFEAFKEGTEPSETSEAADQKKTPQNFFLQE